jgi:hypothetical protein
VWASSLRSARALERDDVCEVASVQDAELVADLHADSEEATTPTQANRKAERTYDTSE